MKRKITAEDLFKLREISGFDLSPDGSKCVYAVTGIDKKTLKRYSDLYLKELPNGKIKRITFGKYSDSNPRFSHCGEKLAFISNRHDEKMPQLYLLPLYGGEAQKLTDLKGSIKGFRWSPDDSRILLEVNLFDKEFVKMINDPKAKEKGVRERHITTVFYKLDGVGYRQKERTHIHLLEVKNKKITQLTKGDKTDEHGAVWLPNGKSIAYITNLTKEPELDPNNDDIVTIHVKSGRKKTLKTPRGPKWGLTFTADGKTLFYGGKPNLEEGWRNNRIFRLKIGQSDKCSDISESWDLDIGGWTINDLAGYGGFTGIKLDEASENLYFTAAAWGESHLYKAPMFKGGVPEKITSRTGALIGYAMDKSYEKAVLLLGNMKDPGELYSYDLKNNKSKRMSSVNINLLKKIDLGSFEEIKYKGAGNNELQGWILFPPGFNEKKKYPSILEIHGGPRVQYGHIFMHEFYYLASKGYIVHFTNPRGGQGYGEKHSKAIWNAWGTVDYDDLMKWTDLICRKKYIDKKKMGVTGGSYGGYMTNWIIGHTNRFKAAVTQRSVSNLISMYGSSDFNWGFQMEFGNVPPWEAMESYWEQSPMKYIGNAKTPTLVIHSEQDLRCAQEQGEQVFVALKRLGVDTELILFPGEPHGLSRGGRTDKRISRLNHILRWFDKYL